MSDNEHKLFNDKPLTGKSADVLFEQYKLYVNLMDNVSARRHQANSFFLTVNSIAISVLTGLLSLSAQPKVNISWLLMAAICGVLFSITWRRLIYSYRQLNDGKFKIIHSLEEQLPARLFSAEWEVLQHGDGSVYKPFSQMEAFVPIVFILMYIALGVFAISTFVS